MKRMLLVTGEFAPYLSADVNCMKKIIEGLLRADYQIDVLTFSYDPDLPECADVDGCRVYRAQVTEYRKIEQFLHSDKAIVRRLPAAVKSICMKLLFSCVDRIKTRRLRKLFFKRAQGTYDVMLSVSYPLDGHKVACRIARRTGLAWVMYNLDPYVYNAAYSTKTARLRKRNVRKWCKYAAACITTEGIREENLRHGYDPYRHLRQLQLPLPNLTMGDVVCTEPEKKDDPRIVLRYTGTFYEDIRRPDELLRFLEKLDPDRFVAEFYGHSCAYLRAHFSALPACVRICGAVSIEECRRLTETADVLVSVGNVCLNQIPSKVFEYISTGKPILNFYNTPDDPTLRYLERYPRILSAHSADEIGEDDLEDVYRDSPRVTSEQLREIYADCLKETVIQKFAEFIEKV